MSIRVYATWNFVKAGFNSWADFKANDQERNLFVKCRDVAFALEHVLRTKNNVKLMTEKEKEYRMVSRAFTSLGFQSRRTSKYRGYIVVRRSTSEMQQHRQLQNVDLESGGVVE